VKENKDESFYAGILRQGAQALGGWDKLRALLDKLAAEDTEKKARGAR
jgi:hypothetical protein